MKKRDWFVRPCLYCDVTHPTHDDEQECQDEFEATWSEAEMRELDMRSVEQMELIYAYFSGRDVCL